MKVLAALLLALLLCRQPGRGRAQDEEDDGEGVGMDSYDDDEDEDREAGVTAGGEPPRCFACQSLHSGEGCSQIQSCPLGQTVCKTLISQGDTGSGPLTTYSGWCADTCQPFAKKVETTLMTVTCCQTTLCNVPPWQGPQGPQGSGAGSPRGVATLATALLLSLLPGLLGAGS
ncbi:glycosylphosphatidylinositol-anchored high density lipoprotein-binding protein 1 isoform X2 [Pteropus alecto]|uniref:Glycosylphosphatidylinositol-anchored high density lipoprotein-binding protein 1 n=1 Tax=Pteropus alecto TaxID=9402 RepID=L5KK15_PTEAL|nr:glycosylphosphatidylinositol-anchored high density lipoprotein-binding protein 1 isoform X2 [Pteropus alecto]ELK11697.1 Glycosylphosphatidylinositol-anchored high density lipoprotein-binding protein 1 [Pteropus alecto]